MKYLILVVLFTTSCTSISVTRPDGSKWSYKSTKNITVDVKPDGELHIKAGKVQPANVDAAIKAFSRALKP